MDREEALARSQSGEKPGGGYYTSSQRIQLRNFGLGRITRLSREVITGKPSSSGGLGRGGAIVPTTRLVDPGALAPPPAPPPVDPQTLLSLQKQISDLVKKNNEQDLAKRNLLETLSKEFDFIKVSVTDLGNNLKLIRNNFLSDERLDRLNAQNEEKERKQAAEQDYRIGREGLIEKKIMGAIMAPINAIGQKLQFTLANVLRFFGILFTGWLVDKLINAFKADAEGNTKKLNDIKNAILKNLGIAGAVLLVLNLGFFRIAGTIAKLAFTVGRFLLSNTLGKLFGGIASLATKLASGAAGMLGIGGKSAAAGAGGAAAVSGASKVTMGAGTADDIAKAGGKAAAGPAGKAATAAAGLTDDAAKAAAKATAAKTAGRFVPGLGSVISGAAAAYDFSQGDPLGGFLNVVGMVPGPIGWLGTGGRLGLEASRMAGGGNKEQPKATATAPTSTSSPPKSTAPTSSPQTSSTPSAPSVQPTTSPSSPPAAAPQSSLMQSPGTPASNEPKVSQGLESITGQPQEKDVNLQINSAPNNVSVTNNVTPLEDYRKKFNQTLTGTAPSSTKVQPTIQPKENVVPIPSPPPSKESPKEVNIESVFEDKDNIATNFDYSTVNNKETNIQNTKINPQTSIMPMQADYTMNLGSVASVAGKKDNTTNFGLDEDGDSIHGIYTPEFLFAGQIDEDEYNELYAEESSTPSPAEVSKVPSKTGMVGPAPQSQPNVVYASSRSQQSNQQGAPLKTGNASDVPDIPSSNPSNFYLLYSQVSYNVVI